VALVRLVQQGKWRQRAAAAQYLGLEKGHRPPGVADAVLRGPDAAPEELTHAARLLDAAVDTLSASSHTGTSLVLASMCRRRCG